MKQRTKILAFAGAMMLLCSTFPAHASAESQQILCGDLDGNGVLNASDLTLLKRGLLSGMDAHSAAIAEVTADGKANLADAEMLRDYLIKKNRRISGHLLHGTGSIGTVRQEANGISQPRCQRGQQRQRRLCELASACG